jgi:protein SCO1
MKMISAKTLNLVVLTPFVFLLNCQPKKSTLVLPVYGEKKVEAGDTIYHTRGNFSLVNQAGETITQETVKNKLYVANFFFATCQSICPEMSTNLTSVQKAFEKDDSLLILSHSVNPLHDTVEVLKNYALTYSAKKNKWHFLTGNKKQIYDLARNDYMVTALEDDGTAEGFLHSELFILIDTKGRIRGMYDGTNKGEVETLITDIKRLKAERD